MKIDKIALENYRNFKKYSIDFGKETTIFTGKNGMGKTNLIAAIAQSLSFIFSKKNGEVQYNFLASSDEKIKSFAATDARFGYENGEQNYQYPLCIKAFANEQNEDIEWMFGKEDGSSRIANSLLIDAYDKFWNLHIVDGKMADALPIFACFHDSYPRVTADIGNKIQEKLDSGNPMPRNTAYYKWNDERNCTEIWIQHFSMHWKNDLFKNGKGNKDYLKSVKNTIINFSKIMSELVNAEDIEVEKLEVETRGKDDVLIVVFKSGNRTPFIQLPQGYKRIFSIVFDIANRAYLLNPNCEPTGIVMIDEIELHLHPSITQEILTALKKTYPKIQFIISTQSPLVITNFKQDENNLIYKLYNEDGDYKNERIEDLYEIDYNSGLRDWMDAPYRKSNIDDLLESYRYWKSAGDVEMIEKLEGKIKDMVGENSEFYKTLN
jgi:predicted ATP-binding protein involved in virulence